MDENEELTERVVVENKEEEWGRGPAEGGNGRVSSDVLVIIMCVLLGVAVVDLKVNILTQEEREERDFFSFEVPWSKRLERKERWEKGGCDCGSSGWLEYCEWKRDICEKQLRRR
jgi:hypothetical protein